MRVAFVLWPRIVIATMCVAAALGVGCSGGGSNASLSASFTESGTASAPNLVKLVKKTASGTMIVVQAVIQGATTSQDIYSFAFDVSIGDPTVVKFVTGSAVAGTALTPCTGQSITGLAELGTTGGGGVDNSRVVVGVTNNGICAGNGIAGGAPAAVIELSFQVLKAGTTTLTLTGSPTPEALDSGGVPIGSITFDAASGTVTGISTGGGGY